MDFITTDDLFAVYEQLKDRYPLVWTNTDTLNEGFTEDLPIIVGAAHDQIIYLYEDGGDFVLDVMDAAKTKGTHWHPFSVEEAVADVEEFMAGKTNYRLTRFKY